MHSNLMVKSFTHLSQVLPQLSQVRMQVCWELRQKFQRLAALRWRPHQLHTQHPRMPHSKGVLGQESVQHTSIKLIMSGLRTAESYAARPFQSHAQGLACNGCDRWLLICR